jgi:ABC-2 type transport system permease protein
MLQTIQAIKVLAARILRLYFSSWKGLVISIVSPLCMLLFLGPTLGINVETVDIMGHAVGYMSFFLPGVMTIAIFYGTMFTAGNAIVSDRVTGFSEMIRVSPNSSGSIVSGHVLGSVLVGSIQAAIFFLIGLFFSPAFTISGISVLALLFVMVGALFFGMLGVFLGSRVAFSNFSLVFTIASIPLVYASTIFVPVTDFPAGLQVFVMLNPVSMMADLLRAALLGASSWMMLSGGLANAVLVSGFLFTIYFVLLALFAINGYEKFPRSPRRHVNRSRGKDDKILASPVFEALSNIIGKEKLLELLPLVQQGRIDELTRAFPADTVKQIISMVKDLMNEHESRDMPREPKIR